ncbi:S-formylglutathione hydrolase FrmB [Sinomonas atrocyanea]|uniref:alpha/beta hydrolase n=1 Tax=Sinomonas atrocyanea TaxID=37927 RepID=UPI00278B9DCE|nr:alpha/beta hydrolase-fold protein [Sinomonas atrocyanea]MDQ0258601.1 S-formylglutathione hydrolase FrmB [Sinomonas atrocyanea]
MGPLTALDLVQGPLATTAALLALPAAAFLLIGRWRRGALFPLVAAALAAGIAYGAGEWAMSSGLSTHPLPLPVLGWIAAAAGALLLAAGGIYRGRWLRRVLGPVAAVLVVAAAALQINAYYGFYRTVGDLAGASTADIAPLTAASGDARAAAPQPVPLSSWAPPADMPDHGQVRSARIPGTASGFTARRAYVYLPPAHAVRRHPALPVLVLVAGQPGSPADWLTAGRLEHVLDAFAAAHRGLAPITVVVDPNGALTANTMCMDSRIARADTYLATDVPAWIAATLDPATDHTRWAIGGFSFGGTCAMQMAALHPGTFRNALVFSGEAEPALGRSRAATIQQSFGGDTAAFEALTPLHQFKKRHYHHSWAYFAAGAEDAEFTACMHTVASAAAHAGMTVRAEGIPAVGHSWRVPAAALGPALDWLSGRLALAP